MISRYPLNTTDFTPIVRAVQASQSGCLLHQLLSASISSECCVPVERDSASSRRSSVATLNGLPAPVLKAQLGPALKGVINYEFWVPTPADGKRRSARCDQALSGARQAARASIRSASMCRHGPMATAQIMEQAINGGEQHRRWQDRRRSCARTTFKTGDRRGEVRAGRRVGKGTAADGAAPRHQGQRHHAVQGHERP